MNAQQLVDDHPYQCPVPVRRPVMVQKWIDLAFLHWPYDPAVVQRLLPDGLTVDTYDGAAWVGLIPFHMEGLGLPGLAPLPHVGRFPEINVRTYVRCGPYVGVWFFSLDIDRYLPTLTARAAYSLPYCTGDARHTMAGGVVTATVARHWPRADTPATTSIAVRRGEPIDAQDPFVRFLTARWGLLSASRAGALRWAAVDHEPWPVHAGELLHLDDTLVRAAGLPAPEDAPHVAASPGVSVRIGRPVTVRRRR